MARLAGSTLGASTAAPPEAATRHFATAQCAKPTRPAAIVTAAVTVAAAATVAAAVEAVAAATATATAAATVIATTAATAAEAAAAAAAAAAPATAAVTAAEEAAVAAAVAEAAAAVTAVAAADGTPKRGSFWRRQAAYLHCGPSSDRTLVAPPTRVGDVRKTTGTGWQAERWLSYR